MFSLHSKIALTNRHTILIKLAYLQGYDKYLISTRARVRQLMYKMKLQKVNFSNVSCKRNQYTY